jgi:outer membrane usher protein
VRLSAEYHSRQFRSPGEYVTTASGVLYPQSSYWLRLSGAYSVPIAWGATASLSARYQFADPQQVALSPLLVVGDRYGADVTLSSPLGKALSGSLTVGYSNEYYLRVPENFKQDESSELRVMVRLFVRPDEKSRISASYDSLNRASYVSAYRGEGRGLDTWEADINMQNNELEQRAMANGSLAYSGNRGEVRLTHSSNFEGADWQHASFDTREQRTSVRMGTAVAFADGRVGIGQPVRGGAFALVYPHESLAGKEVIVGANGEIRARANTFGPALVSDVPAYTRNAIPVDVTDLPVGYSLGAGAFDLIAPYRAGYALEVGSGSSVSAYGTLLLADFSVLGLVSGVAFPADNPLQKVVVFTNKAGRFSAEGLSPGKWVIEMATEGNATRYEIEVPKGTDGLFHAGILRPVGTD